MSEAAKLFAGVFGDPTGAIVAQAPGRVNLIGEHPASIEGFVLATTIDRHVEVIVRRRTDRLVRMFAADLGERNDIDLDQPVDYTGSEWLPSVLGPVHELADSGRISPAGPRFCLYLAGPHPHYTPVLRNPPPGRYGPNGPDSGSDRPGRDEG